MSVAEADTIPHSGPYVWVAPIAKGGMGTVDLVLRQEGAFQRLYALKRLHPHFREDPQFIEMFMNEARVAGLIRHPNVVSVLDIGGDADGPFLVMDFVDGLPLSKIIPEVVADEGLLPLQLALAITQQVAEGLSAAHRLVAADGSPVMLIHRDVSPQNILVGFDGTVKVTDFGVAKALGLQNETTTNALRGKIGYMSPEQLQFDKLDQRSDIFSLGVVLWEMLAGFRLYKGADMAETARLILNDPPPDLADVRSDAPPALEELLFDMLCKNREGRLASAEEVAERLDGILAEVTPSKGTLSVRQFMDVHFTEVSSSLQAQREDHVRSALVRKRVKPSRKRRILPGWRGRVGTAVLIVAGMAIGALLAKLGLDADADPSAEAAERIRPETQMIEPSDSSAAPGTAAVGLPAGAVGATISQQAHEGSEGSTPEEANPPSAANAAASGPRPDAGTASDRRSRARRARARRARELEESGDMQRTGSSTGPTDEWW